MPPTKAGSLAGRSYPDERKRDEPLRPTAPRADEPPERPAPPAQADHPDPVPLTTLKGTQVHLDADSRAFLDAAIDEWRKQGKPGHRLTNSAVIRYALGYLERYMPIQTVVGVITRPADAETTTPPDQETSTP